MVPSCMLTHFILLYLYFIADEMIKEAKVVNGKMKYEDFLKHMIHFVAK
jgi:hypothetical protein